jgi:hypothetical protein
MVDQNQPQASSAVRERVPVMQRVLDNPFLLLFFGVAIPAVIYLMWGLMEISQMPIAK